MAVKKIIGVQNVGRLVKCQQNGPELNRYNIFFAENGRGKTTLCAILRSLQTGEAEHINERKTLAAVTGVPTVEIRLERTTASFNNNAWSTSLPEIAIFDSTFVAQNVHAGEFITRDHRRNLLQVIIGQDGVALAQLVDSLDKIINEKNSEIGTLKKAIQQHIPKNGKIEDFVSLIQDDNIEKNISEKEANLSAAKSSGEIKTRTELNEVTLPSLPQNIWDILSKTLDDVSADASQKIKEQISKHGMHENGEEWLSKGLDYIADDKCAFCGQDTKALPTIEQYKQFFSAAYKNFYAEIVQLNSNTATALSDAVLAKLGQILASNNALIEFWKRFIDFEITPLDYDQVIAQPAISLKTAAIALVNKKQASPFDVIQEDSAFQEAAQLYQKSQAAITAYNDSIKTINNLIKMKKQATQSADVAAIERELALLRLTKLRYESPAKTVCDSYVTATKEKANFDREKATAKDALDKHSDKMIQEYESTINALLKGFGASFSITNSKKSYVGGTPASAYQILINNHPVDLGDLDTPVGTPSFRTTMSAGDKSTLALAFFLAQLEHDPNKANRIVVFDDPFNSQDRSRRERTAELLKKCGAECKQLFLFSHDPYFLKIVHDRFPSSETRTLQLSRAANNNSSIEDWDIEKETQEGYFQDHAALSSYMLNGGRNLIDVARKIRPVLEGYLRYRFPNKFPDGKWLGEMIGIIRDTGETHPLYNMLTELDGINDFSKKYHHDTNPGQADNAPVDDGELKTFAERALNIAGGY